MSGSYSNIRTKNTSGIWWTIAGVVSFLVVITLQATSTGTSPAPTATTNVILEEVAAVLPTESVEFGEFNTLPQINPNVLLDVEFRELEPGVIYMVINTRQGNREDISWENCKMTVLEAYRLAQQIGEENGFPADVWLPLIATESSFHQWVPGPNGECTLNSSGIAGGLGQIYWDVHPEVDRQRGASDPVYNLTEGARIYREFSSRFGDENGRAVSGYKGERGEIGGKCWSIWNKARLAGGFYDSESGLYLKWTYEDPSTQEQPK